jgi:hypothetical protein
VTVNPDGDASWDGPPLDVHIPDDARELERDILAYHRELRAIRRRRVLRRLMPGQAGIMPLMASILAVCLVAGMMLSVFTISPADAPAKTHAPASQSAQPQSARVRPSASAHAQATQRQATQRPATPRQATPRSAAPREQPTG